MPWSVKRRVIVSCSIGWTLTILGAVMIPVLEWVIKKKVESTVVIKEGGEVYEYWLDPPVPIYIQFYMFNLTNPEEFLQGEKPSLSQSGPYTYSERRVKFNITWNSNGTVSYRQKRLFHFIPEMSDGNSEEDQFITPNPVYWTLFNGVKYEKPLLREVLMQLVHLFDEHVLMTRSMKEIIWGYRDVLLNVSRGLDPEWFYTDTLGYFMRKNDTDDGVYTVYTGEKNISQLGIIDRYNGTSHLSFWTSDIANMINGSDGTLGPPYLPKDEELSSFVSDVCRSVSGNVVADVCRSQGVNLWRYQAPNSYLANATEDPCKSYSLESVSGNVVADVSTSQGINLWRYQAPNSYLANATENPYNIGFCTPQTKCLGAGIYNATVCQQVDFFNVPVAFSFPHFYLADERYINSVWGMHPNKEEHETYIDLEPYTGLVLRAAKRLQGNIYLEPLANVSETYNLKPIWFPVFWLNESVSIDDHNAAKLKSLLFTPLKIIRVGEITAISLGMAIVVTTVLVGAIYRVKTTREANARITRVSSASRDDHVNERRPLLQDNDSSDREDHTMNAPDSS